MNRRRWHPRPLVHRSALAVLASIILAACDAGNLAEPRVLRAPTAALRDANVVPAVDVYVPAHQDDWQLFIGDHFAASAKGTTQKVVVIYTTAGDGGHGATYWHARETATQVSVDTIIGAGAWTCASQPVNAHSIQRCVKGKVVSYYMRMPDGNWGDGFGFGSLELLQGGQQTSAIDGSTAYQSWNDFTTTLRAIIASEVGATTSPLVQINAPEYDRIINTGDHADHWATGDAVRAAVQGQPWDQGWWVGYHIQALPANVSGAALNLKKAEFWRYGQSMENAGYLNPWGDPVYQGWLQRTYVRYVNYVPPTPPAAPSNLAASAGSSSVTLTWSDNSADETQFRLQRALNVSGAPGTWGDLVSAAPNTVSYVDASVSANTQYWYRVRAESNAGVSAYSAAVSVTTPPPPPPPSSPTNLLATSPSGSRIDLSWTDVATETSYQVERAPDVSGAPGTYAPLATLTANTTGYGDTGLLPNTRYWYRVRAVNGGGSSAYATASATTTSAFQVDVYVQAYQDDWQLFMGDRVYTSLQTAQRVVLIYTTAGDGGGPALFWNTREAASRASVDTLIGAGAWTCAPRTFGTRAIQRCDKGNVVAYYMRMPDGFWGDGFGSNGSLERLKTGTPTSARDGSTTYASWADFTTTLQTIVTTETGGQAGPFARINAPDYDATSNPSDMPDRYATGDAVRTASQGLHWDLFWYVGKSSQNLTQNVTGAAFNAKALAYRALDAVMIHGNYGSGWFEVQNWLPRTYYRFVPGQ